MRVRMGVREYVCVRVYVMKRYVLVLLLDILCIVMTHSALSL